MSRVDFTGSATTRSSRGGLQAGDQSCLECGLVVRDRVIDIGSEWRTFRNEAAGTDPSRVGGAENPLLNGSDFTTHIGEEEMLRDGKKLKVDPTNAILSACLCIASRQEGVPQTSRGLVSRAPRRKLVVRFKHVQYTRYLRGGYYNGRRHVQILFSFGLSNTVRNAATAVAKAAEDLEIVTGRSPSAVAAAAIYMVSQVSEFKRSPEEISKVAGVSDVTVRQVYKLMYSRAGELFSERFCILHTHRYASCCLIHLLNIRLKIC
ncbi:Transcription initiation factor IIB [Orchesella cincta]|uniref:Transcription initiation factor IIB n=1 Tax=Orchesella cincta TaxID=48709 RepID=A0A1D2M8I8_ORCCI|nr:Transcription initiation factor IIB [Orchesella cincta]